MLSEILDPFLATLYLCILTYARLLSIHCFLDELKLDKEMESEAIAAASQQNEKISFNTMIFGLLTKQILPDATVLAFSRSGEFFNKEFLNGESSMFSIVELTEEDIEKMIGEVIEDPEKRRSILQQIQEIDEELQTQILFVRWIMKLEGLQLSGITEASDLFLYIIRGNLGFQNSDIDAGFTRLSTEQKENLKKTFKMCRENLQENNDGHSDQAGVIKGILTEEEKFQSDSDLEIPLSFLNEVGIFEIPPASFDEVTLTAQHLSFIEMFAGAGILLCSDIKSELEKIKNKERFRAVAIYIRDNFDNNFTE